MLRRCGKVVPGDVLKGPIFWLPNQLPLSSELRSFEEKCDFKAKYKGFTKETTVNKGKWSKSEISDRFFKISRSDFRVRPSYLVFRKLSKYVSRKIKIFYDKLFFRLVGSILDRKSSRFDGHFELEISSIFDQNDGDFHRKNIFSSKMLFSLKTYSVSSLNTKYEPLTPKTHRDSLNFHPGARVALSLQQGGSVLQLASLYCNRLHYFQNSKFE